MKNNITKIIASLLLFVIFSGTVCSAGEAIRPSWIGAEEYDGASSSLIKIKDKIDGTAQYLNYIKKSNIYFDNIVLDKEDRYIDIMCGGKSGKAIGISVYLDNLENEAVARLDDVFENDCSTTGEVFRVELEQRVSGTHKVYFKFTADSTVTFFGFRFLEENFNNDISQWMYPNNYDFMSDNGSMGLYADENEQQYVKNANIGNYIRFDNYCFSEGPQMMEVVFSQTAKTTGTLLEIRLDSLDGELLGSVEAEDIEGRYHKIIKLSEYYYHSHSIYVIWKNVNVDFSKMRFVFYAYGEETNYDSDENYVYISTQTGLDGVLVVGSYASDSLLDNKSQDVSLQKGDTVGVSVSELLDADILKLFLWRNAKSMIPLRSAKSFNLGE